MSELDPHYDRAAASAVLARLAAPGLFGATPIMDRRRIGYTVTPMTPEPGSHLTLSQRLYLERFMRPCEPEQVVSATHRISWVDSDGVPNTGHYMAGGLGPLVPIAVREAVVTLWHRMAGNQRLTDAALDLSDDEFDVLAATTTDHEPIEIFRVGIEATGRALAQHALVAQDAGLPDAAEFAAMLRRSGLFGAVAGSWYWELQASTYRRGMIAARLERLPGDRLRYTPETSAVLAAMKRNTLAEARDTMGRAMADEGLTAVQAVRKYHDDLDVISRQYALLDPGTQPRCLALMPNIVDGHRMSVLDLAVDAVVETFIRMLDFVELDAVAVVEAATPLADPYFVVPDMNCKHCRVTITAVLESHGVEVAEVDLITKHVVAQFDTSAQRDAAFASIRDSGYTVVPGG